MQTAIVPSLRETPLGEEADRILRSCVHCGFCTATCPTYQITGDELDGPRGRIYLIKSLLEGREHGETTQRHLDRCLDCRACETTCPSGVRYSRLLAIGRSLVERQVHRPLADRAKRRALRAVIPNPRRFGRLLRMGQAVRPFLPLRLARRIPQQESVNWPKPQQHSRFMLLLQSCGQPSATPRTNVAAARVLDRMGISLRPVANAGCCGALSHHLDAAEEARAMARNNIDAWWPAIQKGAEAIVITASGCGTTVKEYGELFDDDPKYRERAHRVSALATDLSEVVLAMPWEPPEPDRRVARVACHTPCSLQHAQGLDGNIETILSRLGFEPAPVAEPHLCCGSAGPYSLLHPDLATSLRDRKLQALTCGEPDLIVTANIGCQLHLQGGADRPVRHWIELVDEVLTTTAAT